MIVKIKIASRQHGYQFRIISENSTVGSLNPMSSREESIKYAVRECLRINRKQIKNDNNK